MQGSGEVQKCIKRNQEHFHWETVVGWKFISLDADSSGAPALAGLYLFWPRPLHFGPVFHPKVFSAANTFCNSDCAAPAILWSCFLPKRNSWRKGVDRKDKKSNNSHHWNVKKLILFFTKENMSTVFYSLRGRILKLWDCIFSSFLTVDFCPSGCHFSGHSCHSWTHFSDKIWPKCKSKQNKMSLQAPAGP